MTKLAIPRMLARANEYFRFRVPVALPATSSITLEVQPVDGTRLPRFIQVDTHASGTPKSTSSAMGKEQRIIELTGMPGTGDAGELNLVIREKDGTECYGTVVIEVLEKN